MLYSDRNRKCEACETVGDDISMLRRLLKDKSSLKRVLEEEFCDTLGYKHSSYSLLESVCDEMVEDKLKDIIDVMKFHDQVARTGLTPSQTFPQMMCSEFYKCDYKHRAELR